jgi:hypothetical protein
MGRRSHSEKYGVVHKTMRRRLTPVVATGTVPCARCGDLIGATERWELDHRDDGQGYLGPSHFRCNRLAGWETMMAANGNGRYAGDPALRWSRRWCDEPGLGTIVFLGTGWPRCALAVVCGRRPRCRSWACERDQGRGRREFGSSSSGGRTLAQASAGAKIG